MTSGIPFSKEEIEYIKQHNQHEFPSVIARGLAFHFREYNGGYRSKESVIQIMRRLANDTIDQNTTRDQNTEKKIPDLRKGRPAKKKSTA